MKAAAAQPNVRLVEMTSTDGEGDRVTVYLRGVPLGDAAIPAGDLVLTPLRCLAGYDGFEDAIADASVELWNQGFLQPGGPHIAAEALAPPADLAFELRDVAGHVVHADFVNVVASPRDAEPPTVIVYRRFANAAVASLLRTPPKRPGMDQPPKA